jgi:fructokinase
MQKMRKRIVFGFGEVVYDIILKENKIILGQPGGSVLNALVNLAYRKCNSALISEISNDDLGNSIKNFLEKQGVITEYLTPVKTKTKVALAFLDVDNNASYIFYTDKTGKKLSYKIPELTKNDIFLFGSSAAIDIKNRPFLDKIIYMFSEKEALIFYDPNIRKSVIVNHKDFKSTVMHYISLADIIRGSIDDFDLLFKTRDPQRIFNHIKKLGTSVLIITDADKPVHLFSDDLYIRIPFLPIKAISSVGAGDAFNSGVISSLIKMDADKYSVKSISEKKWIRVIKDSINVSSDVCKTIDNYLL